MKDNFSKTIFESKNLGIVYSTMEADKTIRTEEYTGILRGNNCNDDIKKVIIYHHNDLDGYTAGAVVMLSMECPYNVDEAFDIEIVTKSVNHVKPIEWDPDEFDDNTEVWFVDYPLTDDKNFEFFKTLSEKIPTGHLVYIDHHYASEDLYRKNIDLFSKIPGIIGDYELSGAALAWLYVLEIFGANTDHVNTMPEFVKYVSDWDTFAHTQGANTIKFKYGADTFPGFHSLVPKKDTTFWLQTILWDRRENTEKVKECIYRGSHIHDYAESLGSKARHMTGAEYKFIFDDKEYSVYVINGIGNSLIFGEEYDNHDFVCLWYYNNNLNLYNYSFYSKYDKVNLSNICELFGGGGHFGAAGFRTKRLIFDLAENKTLNLNMCADILGR